MKIKDIYNKFDNIGCLTFTTINEENEPISRIAHLRGYDDDGIYFMTMFTKDFYKHLKNNRKVSICGLNASSKVEHDENGMPLFEGGYSIRMTGNAVELSIDELKNKNNSMFDMCIKDYEKYNAMVVFCIKSAYGDIFDYDFEMIHRDHKLERIYFSYNGLPCKYKGLKIDNNKCIKCNKCIKKCSFKAIDIIDENYKVNPIRCDECGDCYLNCPVKAISY